MEIYQKIKHLVWFLTGMTHCIAQ